MESRKLISATDTQFSSALLASLNEQRISGLFCDITIIVEGKRFSAHKNILSASSTYFHQLFSIASHVVQLTCVRAEIFEAILNYIYSSKMFGLHCNLLEELIRSGKLLGIKFIAELGIPLSEMKSTTNGVNDNCLAISRPNLDQGEIKNKTAFAEDDDDVIFFSDLLPPNPGVLNKVEVAQQRCSLGVVDLSSQQININGSTSTQTPFLPMTMSDGNLHFKGVLSSEEDSSCVSIQSQGQTQASVSRFTTSSHNYTIPSTMLLHHQPSNLSSIDSFPQKCLSPPTDRIYLQLKSDNAALEKAVIVSNDSFPSSTDFLTASQGIAEACAQPEVQKPKSKTVNREGTSREEGQEMENAEVNPGYSREFSEGIKTGPQRTVDGKTLFTLATPSGNRGLSIPDKDCIETGKDPCDIVVSIKDDSDDDDDDDDGEVKLPMSTDSSANSKRLKVKYEDHYEVADDNGKVYYICIICKRSYVSVKNLKRHFNIHTWENKYPCRFCGKVFALGEYRTKHEVMHTGEKRYQCLTCGEAFVYYKSMSSHMKSAHSQDPSRDPKLYRLHPCKSSAKDSKTHPSSSVPEVKDDRLLENEKTISEETTSTLPYQPISWDDLFVHQEKNHILNPSPSKGSAEIEFIIPESY